MVHRPHEMLVENERPPGRLPEAAIGEADAVGLDELCWCGLVGVSHVLARMRHFWTGMNHHDLTSNYSSRIASGTSARAAFAQSTACCTVGAPLTPIAPTTSPPTLMGNPPPYAATRASVGIPARSDGSLGWGDGGVGAVSILLPKIPAGGFSPVRLQSWPIR